MKPPAFLGIVLILVGVLILVYQGFTYMKQTSVINAGPLQVNAEKKETVPISPIIGVVCLGAGLFVMVLGTRKG